MREPIYFFAKMKLLPWYRKAVKGISLRITINNKRSEFTTGIEILCPRDYRDGQFQPTAEGQRAKTEVTLMIEVAKKINTMLFDNDMESASETILRIMQYIKSKGADAFSMPVKMSDIEAALKPNLQKQKEAAEYERRLREQAALQEKENYPISRAMTHYIAESKAGEGRKGTFDCYRKNIERYLSAVGLTDMPVRDFTMGESKRFMKWLKENRKAGDVYAEAHVSFLFCCIEEAIIWEFAFAPNPLQYFRKSAKCEDDTTHLSRGEVQVLRYLTSEMVLEPKLERTKDIFLFMCYTGLHYVDMFSLTREHIQVRREETLEGTTEVKYWLVKPRSKTEKPINQIMHPEAVKILSKYGPPENMTHVGGEKLFNSPSAMNDWLLKLGKIIGATFDITTKIGRKTFADMSLNTYALDVTSVNQMMGLTPDSLVLRKYAAPSDERLEKTVKWQKF